MARSRTTRDRAPARASAPRPAMVARRGSARRPQALPRARAGHGRGQGAKQVAFLDQDGSRGGLLYVQRLHAVGRGRRGDAGRHDPARDRQRRAARAGHGAADGRADGVRAVARSATSSSPRTACAIMPKGRTSSSGSAKAARCSASCELRGRRRSRRTTGSAGRRCAPVLTNANPAPVTVRLVLGWPRRVAVPRRCAARGSRTAQRIVEVTVPGNGRREVTWEVRPAGAI